MKIQRSDEDHSKLVRSYLLKAATQWLEKQNWISSPYGGENYLQDFIFRIKLLSENEWKSVINNDGSSRLDRNQLEEYMEMLKTIDPDIKKFYDDVLKKEGPAPPASPL